MADKGAKKKAKRQKAQPSVLGSLPAQRPQRLGGHRSTATTARSRPAAKEAPRTVSAPRPQAAAKPRPEGAPAPRPERAPTPSPGASAKPRAEARVRPAPAAPPPPRPTRRRGPPRGTELVTTAIKATGELAQIGLTVGGQALKRAVDRLPRP